MIKNKIKISLIKQLLNKTYKADLTGESINLIELIDFVYSSEEEASFSKIFSYTLDTQTKRNIYDLYMSMYTLPNIIKTKIWNLCPEIHIFFFIFYKYGFLNNFLMSFIYLYYLENNEEKKKDFALKFIQCYLYYTVNQLIQDKFVVYTFIEEPEKIEKFLIKNNKDQYTFKNIYSIKEVVNLISQDYIGNI